MISLDTMKSTMARLAVSRDSFCSEADFQHALAWQLHLDHDDWNFRLEYPMEENRHLDIWAYHGDRALALELKYKKRGSGRKEGTDGAYLVSRYDFVKDISRLEKVTKDGCEDIVGYAVLLTNDPLYWDPPRGDTKDAAFRIHEGKKLSGKRTWREDTGEGTRRGRDTPIKLKNEYTVHWHHFAQTRQDTDPGGTFKYAIIRVAKSSPDHAAR